MSSPVTLYSDGLTSATQIDLFDNEGEGCQRKWGFRYIAGLKEAPGPPLLLGTEVDDEQLQPYLREGRALDFSKPPIAPGYTASGYVAESALPLLPAPMTPGMEVQRRFVMPSPTWASGGLAFEGGVDLWLPNGGMPGIENSIYPVVSDFKTASSWKWIKTPETLATNVQAMLYATWAMFVTGYRTIDLAWIYMATKGARKSKRVHLRVHSDHVAEQFARINTIAGKILEARRTVIDPLELEPNPEVCGKFSGCPHQSICNLSPSQQVEASISIHNQRNKVPPMVEETNALLANLKAQNAAAGGTPAPPPPPAPVAAPSQIEQLQAQLLALQAAQAPAPQVPAMTPTPPGPVVPYFAIGNMPAAFAPPSEAAQAAQVLGAIGINPPEQHVPVAAPPPPPPATTATPAPEPEATKATRGRPRGSSNAKSPGDVSGAKFTVRSIQGTFEITVEDTGRPGETYPDTLARLGIIATRSDEAGT